MNAAGSKPSWLGTQHYGFGPAPPGGLALVQDFLNRRMKQCQTPCAESPSTAAHGTTASFYPCIRRPRDGTPAKARAQRK